MFDARLFKPSRHCNCTALCEFDRIREKVHANLLNALFVGEKEFLRNLRVNRNLLACRLHFDNSNNFHDGLLDIHVNRLHLECASLDLSVVERVVHVVKHQDAAKLNDFDVFPLHWIFLSGQQQVSKVDACGKRSAHLVGDIGAVHRSEAILCLEFLQLLNVRDILNEDNDSVITLVPHFLHSLGENLLAFNGLERDRNRRVFKADFEDFLVALQDDFIAELLELTLGSLVFDCGISVAEEPDGVLPL